MTGRQTEGLVSGWSEKSFLTDHLSVVSLRKIGDVPGPDWLSCPLCWPACLWAPDRVLASIFEDCFLHPGPHEFFGYRSQALQCNSHNPPCFRSISLFKWYSLPFLQMALLPLEIVYPVTDTNSSRTSPVCPASSCHLERTWILITARRYQPSAWALQASEPLQLLWTLTIVWCWTGLHQS